MRQLNDHEGGLEKFTRSYEKYGVKVMPDNSVYCREWAPCAEALYLKGDFSESFHFFLSCISPASILTESVCFFLTAYFMQVFNLKINRLSYFSILFSAFLA